MKVNFCAAPDTIQIDLVRYECTPHIKQVSQYILFHNELRTLGYHGMDISLIW
jgi:hypothetical protein